MGGKQSQKRKGNHYMSIQEIKCMQQVTSGRLKISTPRMTKRKSHDNDILVDKTIISTM